MQLLSERERREGYYFKHVLEGLLRANASDRAEFYSKLFNIGVFSINDIRTLENMNPVEGGDIHLVPLNMTTLAQAGKPQEQPSPDALEAPPEEVKDDLKKESKVPDNPLKIVTPPRPNIHERRELTHIAGGT